MIDDLYPPRRPRWAVPALIVGILCSLVVGWISADYAADIARGMSPSIAMVSTIALAPFLVAGVPFLIAGSIGVARPWSQRRPWLPWAIVVGVIGWFLLMLVGPGLVIS